MRRNKLKPKLNEQLSPWNSDSHRHSQHPQFTHLSLYRTPEPQHTSNQPSLLTSNLLTSNLLTSNHNQSNQSNLLSHKRTNQTPSPKKYQHNMHWSQPRGRTLSLIKDYLLKHYNDPEYESKKEVKMVTLPVSQTKKRPKLCVRAMSLNRATIVDMSRSFVEDQQSPKVTQQRGSKGLSMGGKILKMKEKLLRNKQAQARDRHVLTIQEELRPQSKSVVFASQANKTGFFSKMGIESKVRSRSLDKVNLNSFLYR